ncbi:2-oxoacid:acceptor oxidoreductase family protein [Thermogladius sp. 4427co]|uniref:2-oxoacid:acceptor oxidoreductase family protein n=1 Tax=Thermogladius sp. 4427co TaxID=3450718 RepID=UPI003F7B1BF6
MIEIVFIGRGGQGAVTAANILVEAAAADGIYAQGFPFFGAERRGAPVAAFARVDSKPILKHGMFYDADVIVVLDEKLLSQDYLSQFRLRRNGVLVVNKSKWDPHDTIKLRFENGYSLYIVDATGIAVRNKLVVAGWPVVNTSMLGAFSKATDIFSKNTIVEAVRRYFGGRIGDVNAKACEEAYDSVRRVV